MSIADQFLNKNFGPRYVYICYVFTVRHVYGVYNSYIFFIYTLYLLFYMILYVYRSILEQLSVLALTSGRCVYVCVYVLYIMCTIIFSL